MTAAVASLSRPARVLLLEIRRSVVSWAVPLLAVLFFVDAYRTAMGLPAVWTVRSSVVTSSMLLVFAVFAAGLGAWAGSREGRRRTGNLVATTVRPAWARQGAALGGTLFWLLLVFLAGVAVVYIQTARQATWGSPPLWPVAVGVMAVVTITVLGFTAGALVPGRFTAPLAAVAAFVLFLVGYHAAVNLAPGPGLQALLSPGGPVPLADDGVFYRAAPDVAITQVLFMGGITVALLGVLALAPVLRGPYRDLPAALGRAGRWLCAAAVVLLAAGTAAAGRHSPWPAPPGSAYPAGTSPRCTTRPATSRSGTPPTAREPHSRCACTRRSARTWPARTRRSSRLPRRSPGCPAPRSAPRRPHRAMGYTARTGPASADRRRHPPSPGHRRCTPTPPTRSSPRCRATRPSPATRTTRTGRRASSSNS